jgi:NAD(P)-dependent dehydrogenase (short-subunit alcohol dehydrogenase family)
MATCIVTITNDFANQTVIATGGARGIGRPIAQLLATSGADFWIWEMDPVETKPADRQYSTAHQV